MYSSNRNRSSRFLFLILLAIFFFGLFQLGPLRSAEDSALGLLEPVFRLASGLRAGVQNLAGGFQDVDALRAQVVELQNQVNELMTSAVRLRELQSENDLLRQQLAYKRANPDFDLVGATVLQRNSDAARVIAQDPSNLMRSIIVDQGSAEGVKVGMPVVTPQGLVGRVIETGTHWSKVLLIIDASSSVNAVVQSTRATGMAQGGPDPNGQLIIRYVPQGEAIKTGDLILTSGLGGNFPKRLVIGQVTEVWKFDIELFQEASIQPSVDFARLEFVLILKKFTPSDVSQEPTFTPTAIPRPTRTLTPTPKP
jgi:rod shape-determining protein MreC